MEYTKGIQNHDYNDLEKNNNFETLVRNNLLVFASMLVDRVAQTHTDDFAVVQYPISVTQEVAASSFIWL